MYGDQFGVFVYGFSGLEKGQCRDQLLVSIIRDPSPELVFNKRELTKRVILTIYFPARRYTIPVYSFDFSPSTGTTLLSVEGVSLLTAELTFSPFS